MTVPAATGFSLPALPKANGPVRIVVKNAAPAKPLSPDECFARSLANMEKIGVALQSYAAKYGKFPGQAILGPDGKKLLSWRVAILPELGYPELYEQFNASESWNGPHNSQLFAQIPPEYQSPRRFDARTDYIGLSGGGTILGSTEGVQTGAVKDGVSNTLAVFEADEESAPIWTAPVDFAMQPNAGAVALGGPHQEGVLALLANGRLALVPRSFSANLLMAFSSIAGGETVVAADHLLPPGRQNPASPTQTPVARNPPATSLGAQPQPAAPSLALAIVATNSALADPRQSVPDQEALAKARTLLKEVYSKGFEEAKSAQQRQQFVRTLLTDATKFEQSPADYHEVLRIVRELAAGLDDVATTLKGCDLLEKSFQVDALPLRLQALEALSKTGQSAQPIDLAIKESSRIVDEALQADRFEIAIPANDLVLSFTRMAAGKDRTASSGQTSGANDRSNWMKAEIGRIQQRGKWLEMAKAIGDESNRAAAELKANPKDPNAHEIVGKYLCLVKGKWDEGLPHLARAADFKLRGLASLDLETERPSQESLRLADQYWDHAEGFKPPYKRGLQLRAVYLYELAAAGLGESLEKAKTRKRIEDAVMMLGRDDVERTLAPLRAANSSARRQSSEQ